MGAPLTTFEFVFSLYGLLLGFALVELLSGFVRSTRAGDASALGLLTPALSLLVALDLITFWTVLWQSRESIPVNTFSLYVGFFIIAVYYWAASLIFPSVTASHADLDAHYFAVRRRVIAAIILCNFATYLALWIVIRSPPSTTAFIELALFAGLFMGILIANTKRQSVALLATVIVGYFVSALIRV